MDYNQQLNTEQKGTCALDFQPLCRGTQVRSDRSSSVPWEMIQLHLSGPKKII